MKCSDVAPLLDRMVRDTGLERDEYHSAVQDHLTSCPSCRSALRSLAQWDRHFTEAMNDVPVPPGLTQRLLAVLDQPAVTNGDVPSSTPATVTTSAGKRSQTSVRSRRSVTALMVCCVLAICVWGTWRFMPPSTISASEITTLLLQPLEQLQNTDDSRYLLPAQWSGLGRKVMIQDWKQAELPAHRLTIAVIPINVRLPRFPAVTGSLIVIPKSRWKPLPTLPVSQALVQYSPPHVWISWAEGELVYILSINGPAPILEQLQHQLDGNHSVL